MQIGIYLDHADECRFKSIKRHLGLSQNSEVIRLLIKEKWDKLPDALKESIEDGITRK